MLQRLMGGVVVVAFSLGACSAWAVTKDWNDGSDNWSIDANWTLSGVPGIGDTVNIVFADDVARAVTYDYSGPAVTLGALNIDMTGAGTHDTSFIMSANTLSTTGDSIGSNGRGTFTQSGGTHKVGASDLIIGYGATGVGTYDLSGTAALEVLGTENVGSAGSGSITQLGGSNKLLGANSVLSLGELSGTGSYFLSGGTLSGGNQQYVGYSGTGAFSQSGGSNTLVGTLHLGTQAGSTGEYYLSGTGKLSVTGQTVVGDFGTGMFHQTGGTHTISGNTPLVVGNAAASRGTYELFGGSLIVNGNEYVGMSATGNSSVSGGTFLHTGGTNTVYSLVVAAELGSAGSYSQFGGSLVSSGGEFIGGSGAGSFSQSGGVNTSVENINIAASTGSTGSYTMSSTAIASAASIYVGGSGNGAGGTGELTVGGSSAILTVPGTINVYDAATNKFNLQSGTVNAGAINVNGAPSRFNWTSGTLNITDDLTLDSAAAPTSTAAAFGSSLSLGSSKVLKVAGNETIGGNGGFNLTVGSTSNGSASHSVAGNVTLKPGGSILFNGNMTYANLIQAGGNISGTFRNNSNFVYQSGSLTTLINDGTVSFGPTLTVGTLQNEATMTVSNGQLLSAGQTIANSGNLIVNSASLSTTNFGNTGTATFTNGSFAGFSSVTTTNSGTFVVNGGTLPGGNFTNSGTLVLNGSSFTSSSTFTNNVSGSVTAHGSFSGTFVNHGTFTVDGPLTFTNSFTATQDGILQGVGTISNSSGSSFLTNAAGGVINSTTPNGTLAINNFSTNNVGAIINVGPTSTLSLATNNGTGPWTNSGVVNLQGPAARLTGGPITNPGTIQGAGLVTSTFQTFASGIFRATGGQLDFAGSNITVSSTAQLQALSGSTLSFLQGLTSNGGTISLTGGTFENNGKTMTNAGTINGYGTLRTGGLTNSSGRLISVGGGNMDVLGTVTNNGVISIQSGRSAYFFNNVSGSGSFTGTGTAVFLASLSPGNSPALVSFAGGATLGGGTALNMELGGTTVGSGYDKIDVEGQLSIGGALTVTRINGFSPSPWTTFDLLDWGTLSGTFSSVSLPTLTLGEWDTSKLYLDGTLSVTLAGDFNHDAMVDDADYVVWRKGLGALYVASDYDAWRSHYGQGIAGSGSEVTGAAVPEPASCILLIVSTFLTVTHRTRATRH